MAVRCVLDTEKPAEPCSAWTGQRPVPTWTITRPHQPVAVLHGPCRLFSRRSKLLFAGDAFSFFNGHDLAGGNPRDIFAFAIRPAYRYVGRGRFAQTEVHPEVALRDEGTAAADLVNLLVTAGG